MGEDNAEIVRRNRKVILMDPVLYDIYLTQQKRSSSSRRKKNGRA